MNRQEPPPFTLRSLAIWLALGLLGIGLAVAIALVARNLADQPVGIAGEPVSAGRALDPPRKSASGTNPGGTKAGQGSNDRKTEKADGGHSQDDARYAPPVSKGAPGTGSGSGDDSGSGGSGDSHGDEGDGHDDDDD